MYSEKTIDAIDEYYKQANLRFLPMRDIVQMVLAALEVTDEQKALRAFEAAYVRWATSEENEPETGLLFIALVESYEALEKARD